MKAAPFPSGLSVSSTARAGATTPWIGMDGVHRVAADAIGQTTAQMFDEEGFLATMQSSVHIDRWQF